MLIKITLPVLGRAKKEESFTTILLGSPLAHLLMGGNALGLRIALQVGPLEQTTVLFLLYVLNQKKVYSQIVTYSLLPSPIIIR